MGTLYSMTQVGAGSWYDYNRCAIAVVDHGPNAHHGYWADVTRATKSVTFTLPGSDSPTTMDALAYSG